MATKTAPRVTKPRTYLDWCQSWDHEHAEHRAARAYAQRMQDAIWRATFDARDARRTAADWDNVAGGQES